MSLFTNLEITITHKKWNKETHKSMKCIKHWDCRSDYVIRLRNLTIETSKRKNDPSTNLHENFPPNLLVKPIYIPSSGSFLFTAF